MSQHPSYTDEEMESEGDSGKPGDRSLFLQEDCVSYTQLWREMHRKEEILTSSEDLNLNTSESGIGTSKTSALESIAYRSSSSSRQLPPTPVSAKKTKRAKTSSSSNTRLMQSGDSISGSSSTESLLFRPQSRKVPSGSFPMGRGPPVTTSKSSAVSRFARGGGGVGHSSSDSSNKAARGLATPGKKSLSTYTSNYKRLESSSKRLESSSLLLSRAKTMGGSSVRAPLTHHQRGVSATSESRTKQKKVEQKEKVASKPENQISVIQNFLLLVDSFPEMPIFDDVEFFKLIATDPIVQQKWSLLGRYLGVSDEDIADIKKSYYFSAEKCMRMLDCWKESSHLSPTYAKIVSALVNICQYTLVADVKKKMARNSFDSGSRRGMHIIQIPASDSALSVISEEMKRESTSGRAGAKVTIQSDPNDLLSEALVFQLGSLDDGGLRVLKYMFKAAAHEGVREIVVKLDYLVSHSS